MAPDGWELEYTNAGYLLIPAELAARYFPHDTAVAICQGAELWLLPTRGDGAGGLLLKQRNSAGDRAVLMQSVVPNGTPAGMWPASWDEEKAALRVNFQPFQPGVAARAAVEKENGRWVVYLDVGFWDPGVEGGPMRTERRRIANYPSEERARVAARWIEQAADRSMPRRHLGF
jgi:hypothetical protein